MSNQSISEPTLRDERRSCPFCWARVDAYESSLTERRVYACGFDGDVRTSTCRDRERLIHQVKEQRR